jgi:hypothetical protein
MTSVYYCVVNGSFKEDNDVNLLNAFFKLYVLLKISECNVYWKRITGRTFVDALICFDIETKTGCENSSKHVLRKQRCIHKQKKQ